MTAWFEGARGVERRSGTFTFTFTFTGVSIGMGLNWGRR
jgi:hypothetical protein